MKPIYLDYNATTPIDLEVVEAMKSYLYEHFGNPSSSHWYGVQAKKAVEKARQQVANLLNCRPEEVIFTSGGSEANNYAIKGVAFANRQRGHHIITSAIEHPAVIEVCRYLETKGFQVTYLPVDEFGLVDVETLEKSITPQTILITVMHANNEVGTIQPIPEIAKIAKRQGIIVHTDAAQSVGKIPIRVDELDVDLLSVAGHKLYAPKGIGALYIRHGVRLEKLIHGAGHERNLRAGTENVLGIVGLGQACEMAKRDLQKNLLKMKKMRDRLYEGLVQKVGNIKLNGHPEKRLPNTLNVGFANLEANTLLSEMEGIAASAGAACHSGSVNVSAVLTAMKVPLEYAMGTLRFSTGKMTTEEEIDRAIEMVVKAVQRLKPAEVQRYSGTSEIGSFRDGEMRGLNSSHHPNSLSPHLGSSPAPLLPRSLYGPVFAELLEEERLNPLDPGSPNVKARPALDALTVDKALAPHAVIDTNMAKACLSGIWLYHNFLEESHRISQSIPTQTGSYWHGLMHRREPDFSNSKYWFRRVGEHPVFEPLRIAAAELASASTPHESAAFIKNQSKWDPFAFIDLCEACLEGRSPTEILCRQIQKREWELLFDYCFQKAIGR